jgi:hypothetical protein
MEAKSLFCTSAAQRAENITGPCVGGDHRVSCSTMTNPHVISQQAKAYVKRLEDPYASLSFEEEQLELIPPEPTLEQKRRYFRMLENPHAHGEIFGDQGETPLPVPSGAGQQAKRSRRTGTLSKQDFQSGCRRIFKYYVPPAEGRLLRPQYREFITRNENRAAEQRFSLLEELAKYDISTSGNFTPHFNREQELLTAGKLQEIERSALSDIPAE